MGDNVANIILGTDPNDPFASVLGMELHQTIMSMIGGNGGQLERKRENSSKINNY